MTNELLKKVDLLYGSIRSAWISSTAFSFLEHQLCKFLGIWTFLFPNKSEFYSACHKINSEYNIAGSLLTGPVLRKKAVSGSDKNRIRIRQRTYQYQ